MYRNSSAIHLLIVLMGLLTTTSAQAQVGRRTIATIKSDNIRHVVDYGTVQFQEGKGQALLNVASAVPGIVWTFDDIIHPAPVPDSVSLSTIVNSAWVGQDLNLQRLQRFLIDGNGIPLQEIPGVFSSEVVVEAAKDADLAVWLVETSSVVVEAYNSLSNVPLWTFSVPAPFTNINNQSISVSRDGSVVCVAVRDNGPPEITRVYLLNGATGAELKHLDYANRIVSVDLVDDGSACLVRNGSNAWLLNTATGTDSFVGSTIGSSPAKISGDGNVVILGGFTETRVYTKNGASYSQVIRQTGSNLAFEEVAVSRDGSTVVAMAVDFSVGFLNTSTFVFDVASASLIKQHDTIGTGSLQDSPSDVAISDDGSVIAVSSWGTQNNDHPEVMVFDRSVNLIGSIDTAGSALTLDLSGDGRYLIAGSKSVHANISGSGGTTTMYQVYEPCLPRIIYVDADAPDGGDGVSWATAFNSLQDALDASCAGVEIHVAEGTYRPSKITDMADPRTATFQLIDGVAMYGGFLGNEVNRDERRPAINETILSGDLNGDDALRGAIITDNAYHVITGNGATSSTILDGFTITRGIANGDPSESDRGGGMYNSQASPTVSRCKFIDNFASWLGGGMYNVDSHVELTDCIFDNNKADNGGGAVFNYLSSAVFLQCSFYDNSSLAAGGAVSSHGEFTIEMSDCIFDNNRGRVGGAVTNDGGIDLTLENSIFTGNIAIGDGINLLYGGALVNFYGTSLLTNCSFVGNKVNDHTELSLGGAIFNLRNIADFYNCTFYGNSAYDSGGGMYIVDASTANLNSCLLWNNTDTDGTNQNETAQVFLSDWFDPNVFATNYSTIQNWTGSFGGVMNDGIPPLFVDPDGSDNMLGTLDDNVRLLPDSPCINTGSPIAPPQVVDLDGRPRVLCDVVDRGAYEFGLGDDDCDRDVDLFNMAKLQQCFSGGDTFMDTSCMVFDSNNDSRIDLADWIVILEAIELGLVFND